MHRNIIYVLSEIYLVTLNSVIIFFFFLFQDTKWLASHLGNVAEVNNIKNIQFGHVSYVVDTNSKELVVDYIVEKLKHKK